MTTIAIVDYGNNNLRSIQNMLRRVGAESEIVAEPRRLLDARRIILPGIGHFAYAMRSLAKRGLVEALDRRVREAGVPTLGICLGAQLIGLSSEEGGAAGLGWVPIRTVAFDATRMSDGEKIPHIGWTDTRHTDTMLFHGYSETPRFYYVHSYHFECSDPSVSICEATYGYDFVSGVRHQNVYGVQFHPEKSHVFGCKLLENFARMPID